MTEQRQGNGEPRAMNAGLLSTETHIDGREWQLGQSLLPPGLTLLWHPDPSRIGERASLPQLTSGRSVALSRLEPMFVPVGSGRSGPLEDPHLSRRPVELKPGTEGGVWLDCEKTRTRVEVDGVSIETQLELSREALERGVVILLADRVTLLLHLLDPLAEPDLERFGLVGENAAMLRLCRDIRRVADLDVPVLVRGETGTGKELVAGAVHRAGPRSEGPFLAVNLASLPASTAAAELFGAARGAFTGADRARKGLFERAAGGSLFLDEIGEVPAEIQVLLLRALESGEILPLGAEAPRQSDARVIAATDADLESAVVDGSFREPLLHRIAGFVLELPPLRDRRDDLGRLLLHFLSLELDLVDESHRLSPPLPGTAPWMPAALVARLALHSWPGNVRQLRNVVRELVIGSRGADQVQLRPTVERVLGEASVPPPTVSRNETSGTVAVDVGRRRPDQISETELREALRASRWRPFEAARRLGISRGSIYDLMAKCPGIRTATDLTREEIERCREQVGDSIEAMAEALEVSTLGLRRRLKQLGRSS